jgi:hypothetical protein
VRAARGSWNRWAAGRARRMVRRAESSGLDTAASEGFWGVNRRRIGAADRRGGYQVAGARPVAV